jgi:hypothetical protein
VLISIAAVNSVQSRSVLVCGVVCLRACVSVVPLVSDSSDWSGRGMAGSGDVRVLGSRNRQVRSGSTSNLIVR